MKRMMLIINPISGTVDKRGLADRIIAHMGEHGIRVDLACTEYAGHATELGARAVHDGYDAVLACGGDGTVNEVARALCGTTVPLGIIPTGSGNGLARHLEVPIDPIAALPTIIAGHVDECDYGTVNGQPFFCTFGIGFDAAVSDRFAQARSRGMLTYLRSTIIEFMRYKPRRYTFTINGHTFSRQAFIVAGANASQYGNNAYIAPMASIRDGLLDLVIVHDGTLIDRTIMGMDMMTGTLGSNRQIEVHRCDRAIIECEDDGPAHLDGEPTSFGRRLEVVCHPGQLRILTPESKSTFRPILTPAKAALTDMLRPLNRIIAQLAVNQD